MDTTESTFQSALDPKGSSASIEEALDIAADGSGNTYTTGYFSSNIEFNGTTVSTNGSSDMFLVKTNSSGDIDWVVNGGGPGTDRGNSVIVDASGNVIITGFFNGTATFGSTTITSSGAQDVFVAKYNASGTLQWVISAGGNGADIGNGIGVDNAGNVVVAGQFSGSSTFGSTTLTSLNGSIDIFVMKVSSAGVISWAKQGAGKFEDRALAVSCDNAGNSYITGQFSDTLTIDQTHNNLMMNAIFVLKLNGSGAEQWFNRIGGGSYNIAYDIVSDGSGNSYITGDFQGNLTFFGTPPTALTGTENHKIFIAKYNSSGSLQWATSSASSNVISSRSIDIDGSGNSYITGYFECDFDDYKAEYGPAIFTSIGNEDIFIAKYSTSGSFDKAQQFGNRSNAFANGIALTNTNKPVIAGSFKDNISIPTSSNFLTANLALWTEINCSATSYCGDPNYGKYHQLDANGNFDVLITNGFDETRKPYDIFFRSGAGCFRGYPNLQIGGSSSSGASTFVCDFSTYSISGLGYDSLVCTQIAPNVSTIWNTSSIGPTTKQVSLTMNIAGCFNAITDTTTASIYPTSSGGGTPDEPTISDDVVINSNAITTTPINLCGPANVTLTAGNVGNNTVVWNGPGFNNVQANPIVVNQTGIYVVTVTNANGCTNSNEVLVKIYSEIPDMNLELTMLDSIGFCSNELPAINFSIYDLNTLPIPTIVCLNDTIPGTNYSAYNIISEIYIISLLDTTQAGVSCGANGSFIADTSGYHYLYGTLTFANVCDTDVYYFDDSIYVDIYPAPELDSFNFSITGPDYICPDDTVSLIASCDTSFTWYGAGINGLTTDTVEVYSTGTYTVGFSYSVTNQYGCTSNGGASAQHSISAIQTPNIAITNTFLCPGDTAIVYITNSANLTNVFWQGPSGNINVNNDSIYITSSGLYYCFAGDSNCQFESNVVEVTQYNTPDINAAGSPILCEGDSVLIAVSSTNIDSILWLPPLSGNNPYQTVDTTGIFQCQITSCGITNIAEIEVVKSTSTVEIFKVGVLCKDSSAIVEVDSVFIHYDWSHIGFDQAQVGVYDSGLISITVQDTDGCFVSDTTNVPYDQIFADIELTGTRGLCYGDSMTLYANAGHQKYRWTPGNDTTSSIVISQAGTYTLYATDTFGCRSSAPIEIVTPDTVTKISIDGDLSFCEGDSVIFKASRKGKASYQWTPNLGDTHTVVIKSTGTYSVTAIDTFGCEANSQSIDVFVQANNLFTPIGFDTLICAGDVIDLFAAGNANIQWMDSASGNLIDTGNVYTTSPADSNMTIYLWSTFGYCISDSSKIYFEIQDCENMFVPNYFTPNADGWNDVFKADLPEHTCFTMRIYNRWGLQVHYSTGINMGWDGSVNQTGEPAPEGSYFYLIEFCRHDGSNGRATGSLTLIREN